MTGISLDQRAAEFTRRLASLRALLEGRGANGCLLRLRRNFAWLTVGGVNHVVLASEEGAAPLLVTLDDAVVLAPVNEAARIADEELAGLPLAVASLDWFEPAQVAVETARRTGGPVLDDAELESELNPLRSMLSAADQARLTWLGEQTQRAFQAALPRVARDDTEQAAAAQLVGLLGAQGIRAPVCLAAADDRIERYRHPLPTDRPIARRLMLVVVAERWGLHVAATRFRELVPPEPPLAGRIDAAGAVQRAMHAATLPGATLGDVLEAARRVYRESGHAEEWRLHHQGGSIGYQGRERVAVPGDPTPIRPGMAFAWNPSISGAKAEETIVLGVDGAQKVVTA